MRRFIFISLCFFILCGCSEHTDGDKLTVLPGGLIINGNIHIKGVARAWNGSQEIRINYIDRSSTYDSLINKLI